MGYTYRSVKYLFKNFFYMIPFAVLPAVLLALSMDAQALDLLAKAYLGGNPAGLEFTQIFHAVSTFNFHSWGAFSASVFAAVAMIVCGAMLMALIEKHMRIGKRTFNGLLSKINDNLVSCFAICCWFILLYELWSLVASAFLFVVSRIDSKALSYVLSVLLFFGSQFVLNVSLSAFYLWLPCLQITGFKAFEALRYSNQLVAPVLFKIAVSQFVGLTAAELCILLSAYFFPTGIVYAVSSAVYVALILVFCIRMEVAYFERAGIERADLRKYYFV